ncbi:chromate transporter [Mycoplana sp. BE70]|uniref:chromate transporter n=1 Tax=Mycoplana sp. BE70 TaxID=2817775 RepID=UPI00285B4DC4|nr:chromate transporter [Mycoplana sp. BE70]MDR6756420.1 chromate transporter [Mycoplana sp. BE70]
MRFEAEEEEKENPALSRRAGVPRVGLPQLFQAFLLVGLSGFGGVLPFIRRMLVEERKWLTASEFTEVLALSQLLPGPNVINITVHVGARMAGIPGAVIAFLGLMIMPIAVVIGLSMLYARYGDLQPVEDAFRGIASAAAGLIVAMAAKIAWPVLRSARTIVLAAMVFVAMAFLGLPLVWIILLALPVAILWTWVAQNE